VVSGDVADLVAKREGQLRLIVHQGHQLASDVDVAARDGEGILDSRVQDGEAIGLRRDAGISSDPASD